MSFNTFSSLARTAAQALQTGAQAALVVGVMFPAIRHGVERITTNVVDQTLRLGDRIVNNATQLGNHATAQTILAVDTTINQFFADGDQLVDHFFQEGARLVGRFFNPNRAPAMIEYNQAPRFVEIIEADQAGAGAADQAGAGAAYQAVADALEPVIDTAQAGAGAAYQAVIDAAQAIAAGILHPLGFAGAAGIDQRPPSSGSQGSGGTDIIHYADPMQNFPPGPLVRAVNNNQVQAAIAIEQGVPVGAPIGQDVPVALGIDQNMPVASAVMQRLQDLPAEAIFGPAMPVAPGAPVAMDIEQDNDIVREAMPVIEQADALIDQLAPVINNQPAPVINNQPAPVINNQPAPVINNQPALAIDQDMPLASRRRRRDWKAEEHNNASGIADRLKRRRNGN